MDFLKNIKKETIIVCNNSYKEMLLNEIDKIGILPIKFISLEELKKSLFFDYDEKTVFSIMNKFNVNSDVARMYIDNLYFVENINYQNEKLDFLVSIKKYLDKLGLLKYDDLFETFIKNKKIYFVGFNNLDKFTNKIINKLSEITDIEIIKKEGCFYDHDIYHFDNINEEVMFAAQEVSKLIEKGVDISHIKFDKFSDDYSSVINRVFNSFNLKISLYDSYVYGSEVSNYFLEVFEKNISNSILKLKNRFGNNDVVSIIIDICNNYAWCDDITSVYDLIVSDLKTRKLPKSKYDNSISVIDFKNGFISSDDYVFILGFNQGFYPLTFKDEDYLDDNAKKLVDLDLTVDKNMIEKNNCINSIKRIKNLFVSFKDKTPFDVFYPSNLIEELDLNVKNAKYDIYDSFSKDNDLILLCSKLDDYKKYGKKDNDLFVLYNNYMNHSLYDYDHKFSGVDKNLLKDFLGEGFNLSYSDLNNFYKCKFRYYLDKILKVNVYEDTFGAFVGSLFHYGMEYLFDEEVNIEDLFNNYITQSDKDFTNKELYFLDKFKKDFLFIFDSVKEQFKYISLDNHLCEERIVIDKSRDVKINFKGFVDKILYKEVNGNSTVMVIDYKTGKCDVSLKYAKYGIDMQLPIYLYLIKKSEKFDNVKFGGFYLQKLLGERIKRDSKKTYQEQLKSKFKLIGYSNSDKDILSLVDNNFEKSNLITSMGIKKTGEFYEKSKILNNEQFNCLVSFAEIKIDEAIDDILNGNFEINPKVEDNNLVSCEYCKYRDICFMKKDDEINIVSDKDLSFLGGEEDA